MTTLQKLIIIIFIFAIGVRAGYVWGFALGEIYNSKSSKKELDDRFKYGYEGEMHQAVIEDMES